MTSMSMGGNSGLPQFESSCGPRPTNCARDRQFVSDDASKLRSQPQAFTWKRIAVLETAEADNPYRGICAASGCQTARSMGATESG